MQETNRQSVLQAENGIGTIKFCYNKFNGDWQDTYKYICIKVI